MSCEKHKDFIEGYDFEMNDLVIDISNLRYDALASFLNNLSAKLMADAVNDFERDRYKLATRLKLAGIQILKAQE